MVGLPRFNQYRNSVASLPELLLSLCKDHQAQFGVRFDVRFQPGLDLYNFSYQAANMLSTALEQASVAAAPESTVEIAIHQTRRGMEIEIVAISEHPNCESLRAFCREKTIVGIGQTLSLFRARCPDGALAWIIVQSGTPKLRQRSA
ncbi:MAG: hypothetical protein U0930_00655 [Pirellulales bacterium]